MGDRFVGLIRVSTEEQEESELGLIAGQDDIDRYIESVAGELVTTLKEVESGKHDRMIKRPVLLKALALCKRHKAILLVPKVDRLIRSTQVHTDIKRSGVKFRAVDNPHANEFTLDILVAVAANEARAISDRTKKGLKAYKDHGKVSLVQRKRLILKFCPDVPLSYLQDTTTKEGMARLIAAFGHVIPPAELQALAGKLGSHLTGYRLTDAHRALGRAVAGTNRTKKSVEVYEDLLSEIREWRAEPATFEVIADRLNERGDRTRNGARWGKSQVKRLLDRALLYRKD